MHWPHHIGVKTSPSQQAQLAGSRWRSPGRSDSPTVDHGQPPDVASGRRHGRQTQRRVNDRVRYRNEPCSLILGVIERV